MAEFQGDAGLRRLDGHAIGHHGTGAVCQGVDRAVGVDGVRTAGEDREKAARCRDRGGLGDHLAADINGLPIVEEGQFVAALFPDSVEEAAGGVRIARTDAGDHDEQAAGLRNPPGLFGRQIFFAHYPDVFEAGRVRRGCQKTAQDQDGLFLLHDGVQRFSGVGTPWLEEVMRGTFMGSTLAEMGAGRQGHGRAWRVARHQQSWQGHTIS